MGSYWSLNVKKLNILYGKSYVWPDIGVLFRDDEWCSEWVKDHGFRYKRYLYRTTAGAMAARLDLSGHDLASAKAIFKRELKGLVRERQDLATRTDEDGTRDSPYAKAYDSRTLILSRHTFSRWSKSFSEIVALDKEIFSTPFYTPEGVEIPTADGVCPETEHLIRATAYDDDIHLGFPGGEYLPLLRSICAAVNPNESIELDFTDLVNGRNCKKRERFYDSSLQQLSYDYLRVSPIIILTEGSSDAEILKLSLAVLFPHLTQMIRFMDFSSSNAAGGASALVSQVRAFAGSGIKNRIIALFDNDVAATTALTGLPNSLPDNIKVIQLPNLRRLHRYPCNGPAGRSLSDVNKGAASIELYTGPDTLPDGSGGLIPVQWGAYHSHLKQYQGEVLRKKEILIRFRQKAEAVLDNRLRFEATNWADMNQVWLAVLKAAMPSGFSVRNWTVNR